MVRPWPVQLFGEVLWTWFLGLQYRHVSVPRYVGSSPPSLPWVPAMPVPHVHRYYEGRTTAPDSVQDAFRRPVPLPRDASSLHGSAHLCRSRGLARLDRGVPSPVGGRKEIRSYPRFLANPFESAPRARDSGGSSRPRPIGRSDAAFRSYNSVGIRNEIRFRS